MKRLLMLGVVVFSNIIMSPLYSLPEKYSVKQQLLTSITQQIQQCTANLCPQALGLLSRHDISEDGDVIEVENVSRGALRSRYRDPITEMDIDGLPDVVFRFKARYVQLLAEIEDQIQESNNFTISDDESWDQVDCRIALLRDFDKQKSFLQLRYLIELQKIVSLVISSGWIQRVMNNSLYCFEDEENDSPENYLPLNRNYIVCRNGYAMLLTEKEAREWKKCLSSYLTLPT